MNILVPDSWLREFLETDASPQDIMRCLSLCGPSVERINCTENDSIYDIEITSNRADCAGIYGIAREANAILPRFGFKSVLKPLEFNKHSGAAKLTLTVDDSFRTCKRLMAVVLDNISVRQSGKITIDRLQKCGVRPLDNIIDITNYVMLETGHPVHIFDYDRIKTGKLILRHAKKGEKIITLDEKSYTMDNDDVIIDDGTGRIIDLPGIMGTSNSVVTKDTKRAVLFIESNDPLKIRKTSMRLGVRTMAATINEKNPDPQTCKTAFYRALDMFMGDGAKIAGKIIDIYPAPLNREKVSFSLEYICTMMGINLTKDEVCSILTSLGFEIISASDASITIIPPIFRIFDIREKEDVLEEIARVWGYHNLPSEIMLGKIPLQPKNRVFEIEQEIKTMLKYLGFSETYNYSFISKDLIRKAGFDEKSHLKLSNPLTKDLEFMRISLIPSVLENMAYNKNFSDRISLFELSKVYSRNGSNLPKEELRLVMADYCGFSKMKGLVKEILDICGIITGEQAADFPFFSPAESLGFYSDNVCLAAIGKINPKIARNFSIPDNIYIADINFEMLTDKFKERKTYIPVPKFPPVIEDLTFVMIDGMRYRDLEKFIRETDSLIHDVKYVTEYKNTFTLKIYYLNLNNNMSNEEVAVVRNKLAHKMLKNGIKIKGMTD